MEKKKRKKLIIILSIIIVLLLVGVGSYFVIDKYFSKDDVVDKGEEDTSIYDEKVLYKSTDIIKKIDRNTFFDIDNLVNNGYLKIDSEDSCYDDFENIDHCVYRHQGVREGDIASYYISDDGKLMLSTWFNDDENPTWIAAEGITEPVSEIYISKFSEDSTTVLTENGNVYRGQNGNREYVKLDLPDKVIEVYYDDGPNSNFRYVLLENGEIYGLDILKPIEEIYEYTFGFYTRACGSECMPNILLNLNREIFFSNDKYNNDINQFIYNNKKIYANVVFYDRGRNYTYSDVENICIIDKNNDMYIIDGETFKVELYNKNKVSEVVAYIEKGVEESEKSYFKVIFEDKSSMYFSYSGYLYNAK